MLRRSVVALLSTAVLLCGPGMASGAGGQGTGDGDRDTERFETVSIRVALLYGHPFKAERQEASLLAGGRSVPLAFGMSAVVPGLGQVYNRQWLKAGISLAAEVAILAGYITWRNDGLAGERAFRARAHAEWSPTQYASWINDYATYLEAEHGASFSFQDIVPPTNIDFSSPGSWSDSERVTVRSFFNQIRAAEFELFHPETGASFSHRLPEFGDQQYYELIGKYFQFAPGWTDYPQWLADGSYTDAIDPERSNPDGTKQSVSPTFYDYAREHAHSQDLLRRASRMTSLLVVNHLVAAIDAAVFSKLHNDRLDARLSMTYDEDGRPSTTATLTLTL